MKRNKPINSHAMFVKGMFESWAKRKNVGVLYKEQWIVENSFTVIIFEGEDAVSRTVRFDDKLTPGQLELMLNKMLKELRKTNE